MVKVVAAQEMVRIEKLAYGQGASEEEFMNRAGEGVAEVVQRSIALYHIKPRILFLCGRGNNAGDAYVAAKILHAGGFEVHVLALAPENESSPLCKLQAKRFLQAGGRITYISHPDEATFGSGDIIVDGILGTGFHGQVEGLFAAVIEKANRSGLPIIAIDIPSGIDGTTGQKGGVAIVAQDTLFLGLPKIGCFLGEAWNHVGRVHVFDFGLEKPFIDEAQGDFELIEDDYIRALFPPIIRVRHKYQAGHVVGVGGSPGMPGAAILSSYAALRAGAGIVRLFHPQGMEAELAAAPFEVIRIGCVPGDPGPILKEMERAGAIFLGPGMGTSAAAEKWLAALLPKIQKPCVIDAEALTLLAKKPMPLPKETVLTPQHAEMMRLLGQTEDLPVREFLKKCQTFAEERSVTLVIKGAPTFIVHPHTLPFICTRGDPGMATAGSGDVLTGIVAAFLAQKKPPLEAACLAAFLHGVAGERAALSTTSYCMVASDITKELPAVFAEYSPSTGRK